MSDKYFQLSKVCGKIHQLVIIYYILYYRVNGLSQSKTRQWLCAVAMLPIYNSWKFPIGVQIQIIGQVSTFLLLCICVCFIHESYSQFVYFIGFTSLDRVLSLSFYVTSQFSASLPLPFWQIGINRAGLKGSRFMGRWSLKKTKYAHCIWGIVDSHTTDVMWCGKL